MSGQSGFKSIRKLTSRAWSYILETSTQHPSLVAYARYSLPVKYKYERPDFLQLDDEGIVASADHEIRPIVAPKTTLLMNAGYAEVINAGKSLKTNEDQSCFHSFVVSVPIHQRKEEWKSADCHIPCVYFAIFDGHAGTGAAIAAYKNLHHHIKEQLTNVAHMLVITQEDFEQTFLTTGLILSIENENLVIGAIEQAFIAMDEEIKQQRYDFRIDGGCTALVALLMLGRLFVANAGDCRAVICRNGTPHPMSFDHNPESERKRIQTLAYYRPELLCDQYTRYQFQHRCRKKELGTKQLFRDYYMDGWSLKTIDRYDMKPQVISGEGKRARLLDTIGTTRGFGDHDLEVPYCADIKIKPFLLAAPEVQVFKLYEEHISENDILVMATDGLWEKLTNENVCEIVNEKLNTQDIDKKRLAVLVAQTVVDEARGSLSERGWRMKNNDTATYDDISVFVIPLFEWRRTLQDILKSHLTQIAPQGRKIGSVTEDGYLNIPHLIKQTNDLENEKVKDDLEAIDNSYGKIRNVDIPELNNIELAKTSEAEGQEEDTIKGEMLYIDTEIK